MGWAKRSLRRRSRAWSGTIGSLRLADELGRGAHGTVWRAWNYKTREWVAVKLFSERGGEEGAWRFMREQRLEFDHPSIIKVRDFGSDSNGSYLVTELLSSGTLEDYVAERGALGPDLVLTWGQQLLDALAVVAAGGVIHRDVKPANLMLRDEPDGARIVLADFGQAWVADGADLTSTPGPVGTAGYIAPELGSPHAVATTAADVYAAGITLRRAVTGGGPNAPLPESTPTELVDLLDRLTAAAPSDRPTPEEAAEEFGRLRQHRIEAGLTAPGRARVANRTARPPDPYLRRKVAVGVAVLLVANTVAVWALTRPDPPPGPTVAADERVAWDQPVGPMAVSDRGVVYTADQERGVIYRVTDTVLVPVAGGGSDRDGRGKARSIDLSSALRLGAIDDAAELTSTIDWDLSVDSDGALWLNTGDIWRITPQGDAERLLQVPAKKDAPVLPYRTSSREMVDQPRGSESVLNRQYAINALPSPLMPRDGGVDFADAVGDRIAHLDARGHVSTVCDLGQTHRSVALPTGTTASDDDGNPISTLLPGSFTVIATDDCWVVDAATGEVAHVKGGRVVATFYGTSGEATKDPGWSSALPSSTDGVEPPTLLGALPDGTVVITLEDSGTVVGLLRPDDPSPAVTVAFKEMTDSTSSSPLFGAPVLRLSEDGRRLSSKFSALTVPYGTDPRTVLSDTPIAVFDARQLLSADEVLVPDALTQARQIRLYQTASNLRKSLNTGLIGGDATPGLAAEQLLVDRLAPNRFSSSPSGFVASLNSDPWIWRFGPRPRDRMDLLAAITPKGVRAGQPGACSPDDVAAAPDGKTIAVLCRRNDDGPQDIVSVRVGSKADPSPRVLASGAAFRRAAHAVQVASGNKITAIGPQLNLSYASDGRLVLFTGDEKGAFEVRGGELHPLTSFRPERDPDGAKLRKEMVPFEDDPVRVRALLEHRLTDAAGSSSDMCSTSTKRRGAFAPRDVVPISRHELVMSYDRCLVVVTPGKGTRPLDPDVDSEGITRLAVHDRSLLAYQPSTNEIWRYSLDGGKRQLVAGRPLAVGVSPDGAKAAGSPIGQVAELLWSPTGQPCFRESSVGSVRCVDERGALETVIGKHVS